MHELGIPELVVLLVVAGLLIGGKRFGELAQLVSDGIDNFRGGGPGSPSHPIPANDSKLLNRKIDRSE